MLSGEKLQLHLEKLFPINRSLTGRGNLQTLQYLKQIVPSLSIQFAKSGKGPLIGKSRMSGKSTGPTWRTAKGTGLLTLSCKIFL